MTAFESRGPWLPTSYLRWRVTKGTKTLQQKMRRRVKKYVTGSAAHTFYEYEWQDLIEMTESVNAIADKAILG
jgi:hypothetical protein